MLALDREAVS